MCNEMLCTVVDSVMLSVAVFVVNTHWSVLFSMFLLFTTEEGAPGMEMMSSICVLADICGVFVLF